MKELNNLGKRCQEYRLQLGKLQSDVSKDTGYSIENVSKFENGRNNNLLIFLWYLDRGFVYERT